MAKPAPKVELIQVVDAGDGKYLVPSQTDKEVTYTITDDGQRLSCECTAGQNHKFCVHVKAVLLLEKFKNRQQEEKVVKQETGPSKTKNGYLLDEVTSAMHKEIRLGREEMAVFWALELQTIAPNYVWKRLVIQASEDVGLADPEAVRTVIALAQGYAFCKTVSRWFVDPEALVHAVMVMCRAAKSCDADDLKCLIENRIEAGWRPPVPDYAVDDHTARGRELKKASGKTDDGWAEFYKFRQRYLSSQSGHFDQGRYFEKLREEFPKFVGKIDDSSD